MRGRRWIAGHDIAFNPHDESIFNRKVSPLNYPLNWLEMRYWAQGHVEQSVTCLTAEPGVTSSISAKSHTFRGD